MTFNDFLKGLCFCKVRCKNTELFINIIRKKTSVKRLKYIDENTISFVCFLNEEKEIVSAAEKNNSEILSIKFKGMPVILKELKKRTGLLAGSLVFVLLVAASTFFIWEIRVEGNERISSAEIELMLSRAGLCEGMLKKGVDVKSIVNKVLISNDELSWLAVNFDGTVAHVEVKEAKIGVPEEKKENVNLVASNNGIIMRVDALEGESVVSAGDAVEKGSLLVSAFVEKRTGGSLLRGARGFVWAQTERKYRVNVPLEYCEKAYTGKEKSTVRITFLGRQLIFSPPFFSKPSLFERTVVDVDSKVSSDKKLPFEIDLIKETVFTLYKRRRPENVALEIARDNAMERLELQNPSFKMTECTEKYEINDNILVYDCVFCGVENIAQKMEFELS